MGGKRDETAEERSKRKEKEKREGLSKKKDKKRDETPEERAARKAAKSSDGKSKDERKEKSAKASKQQQSGQAALKEKKQKSRGPPVGMMMQEKGGSKNDYLAGMDLPSSSDDEDVEEKVERDLTKNAFDGPSDKEVAKARKKEIEMARKEAMAKEEAMRDDDDAFNVRLPAMDDQAMAQMANSRDIKIDNFSVSVRGKPLLTDTNITIAHGRRYGIVGPNGTGKTTLMKLLARRKIPVPEFIDILLVEQEVVGDERTALESVVAADVELMELRQKKMEYEQLMEKMAQADESKNEALIKEMNQLTFKDEETDRDGRVQVDEDVRSAETERRRYRGGESVKDSAWFRFYCRQERRNERHGSIFHAQFDQELFRRLENADFLSSSFIHRTDVFIVGRTDESLGFTSGHLVRRVLDALEEDFDCGFARSRFLKRCHDGYHPFARPPARSIQRKL